MSVMQARGSLSLLDGSVYYWQSRAPGHNVMHLFCKQYVLCVNILRRY